jgi:hypothetical protein
MTEKEKIYYNQNIITHIDDSEDKTVYFENASILRSIKTFLESRGFTVNEVELASFPNYMAVSTNKVIESKGTCQSIYAGLIAHIKAKMETWKWKLVEVSYSHNEPGNIKDVLSLRIAFTKYSVNSPKL